MDELKIKAILIARDQDIRILKEKLATYSDHLNNIHWDENTMNLGQLRDALIKHINMTIGKSSIDLEIFINHFR